MKAGTGAGARGDEERLRFARTIVAVRDARAGRGQAALDTLARLGSEAGAPMVFLAKDDALAVVGADSAQAAGRVAWLASRNVNLRSIPLAIAWQRARLHRRVGAGAPPA